MNRRIAVRAIILDDDGKLFCVQLRGNEANQYWCLPGGGLEEGEALKAGIHREIIEETNVAPEIGELLYVQQFSLDSQEHMEFFFHVTNTDDYKNIDISAASHAEEEIIKHDFVDPKEVRILPELLSTENLAQHIKDKVPTKIFNYL